MVGRRLSSTPWGREVDTPRECTARGHEHMLMHKFEATYTQVLEEYGRAGKVPKREAEYVYAVLGLGLNWADSSREMR